MTIRPSKINNSLILKRKSLLHSVNKDSRPLLLGTSDKMIKIFKKTKIKKRFLLFQLNLLEKILAEAQANRTKIKRTPIQLK